MFYKTFITFMIMVSMVFAIQITFPDQPDMFICNQNAIIECDTNSSTTASMSWYLDNVNIADCLSSLCTTSSQSPPHYLFTPGPSSFTLTLNPAKREDSGKSVYCEDTTTATSTTSNPKTINVEVEPMNSTTTINYVVETTVSLDMTACLYPVENLVIKWTSKKGDSVRQLSEEQPTTGSSCQSGSTDCMATSIVSEIELDKGSDPDDLYSVCIEILRADVSLLTKCTDQNIPLKDLETTTKTTLTSITPTPDSQTTNTTQTQSATVTSQGTTSDMPSSVTTVLKSTCTPLQPCSKVNEPDIYLIVGAGIIFIMVVLCILDIVRTSIKNGSKDTYHTNLEQNTDNSETKLN